MRRFPITLLFTVFCISDVCSDAQNTDFLTNGLAAYYPLNGNADDESGNGNNGTVIEATWWTGMFGPGFGSALHFAGKGKVVVPDAPCLDPGNAITLAAWFKADRWGGNNRLIHKGNPQYQFCAEGGYLDFTLGWNITNRKLRTTLPSPGIWHHGVATYDGKSMRIYVDGKAEAEHSASGLMTPAGNRI